MRFGIACLALLAVAATSRGGCGKEPYEPCAGRSCGAACTVCAPDDAGCAETAVLKACDPSGSCVPSGSFACATADPCSGKACGAECTIDPPCRSYNLPCGMPSVLGHCDAGGACTQDAVSCGRTGDQCAGKPCGTGCAPWCGTGPCMTLVATVCDGHGQCVTAMPGLCYDGCAGKKTGDSCDLCPPDATDCMQIMCVTACDAMGRCLCGVY